MASKSGMVCSECGSTGEDGEVEFEEGMRFHWRKFPKVLTKPLPVWCSGKFVEKKKERKKA